MLPTKYPINEIFFSIQGEGFASGTPAIFVRFSGCNLSCSWCDTDHQVKNQMTIGKIVYECQKLQQDGLIVLTGGEPSIHNLQPLLRQLRIYDYTLAMETNGSFPDKLKLWKEEGFLDYITVSPKPEMLTNQKYNKNVYESISLADEIKVVDDGEVSLSLFENLASVECMKQTGRAFVQPCSQNYQSAVNTILKSKGWRLSVQLQKVINVR